MAFDHHLNNTNKTIGRLFVHMKGTPLEPENIVGYILLFFCLIIGMIFLTLLGIECCGLCLDADDDDD